MRKIEATRNTPKQMNNQSKTMKTIHLIELPSGLVFTSKRDFTETLFSPIHGKTADGYFKISKSKKHGTTSLRFHYGNDEVFALIVSNGRDAEARTAWKQDGKIFCHYGLSERCEKMMGFYGMGLSEKSRVFLGIVAQAERGGA